MTIHADSPSPTRSGAHADRVDALGTDLVAYVGVESYPDAGAACAVPTAD